jgi:hypothetical protein
METVLIVVLGLFLLGGRRLGVLALSSVVGRWPCHPLPHRLLDLRQSPSALGGPAACLRMLIVDVTVASILAMITFAAGPATAQMAGRVPMTHVGATVEGQDVEGIVTRVNSPVRTITLDNGQDYLLPHGVPGNPDSLEAGVTVTLRYSTEGGRNIVTHVLVRP